MSPPADRPARLLARIVDAVAYFGPTAVGGITLALVTGDDSNTRFFVGMMLPVQVLLVFIVNLWLLAGRGQTLGKLALGLRIVRTNDKPAGLGRILLLRMAIPRGITLLPLLALLGDPGALWPALVAGQSLWLVNLAFVFREDRRCGHDLLAGTKVVES